MCIAINMTTKLSFKVQHKCNAYVHIKLLANMQYSPVSKDAAMYAKCYNVTHKTATVFQYNRGSLV